MSFIVNDSMPRNCTECSYRCGLNIIARRNQQGRHEDCPLKELPPHGRLIDADKLKKKMGDFFSTGSEVGYMWLVDDAPTVLEASN